MITNIQITEALREVEDPELPVNIVDLGLLRGIQVDGGNVTVRMTFTSVACPASAMIMEDVRNRLMDLDDVENVDVEEVFDTWSRDDVTPEGQAMLSALAVT